MHKTLGVALATAALSVALSPTAHASEPTMRPCKYEDSRSCVWDARHMGNGQGRSFVALRNGSVVYVSHRVAHALING